MTKDEIHAKLTEAGFIYDMKIGSNECFYRDGMRAVLESEWFEFWGKKSYLETEPRKIQRIDIKESGISFIMKDSIHEIFY